MKTQFPKQSHKLVALLQDFRKNLTKIYGQNLRELVLFGSYARGDFHENSDIDILLVLENYNSPFAEINRISEIKYDFLLANNLIINIIPTNLENLEHSNKLLFKNIREEGIIL
jgi:predicted nucleotidyltransferase